VPKYRAEIWAVDHNGSAAGIESDVTVDDIEAAAWSGALLGANVLPGRNRAGHVYVRIGNRTAAADLVTSEHGRGRATVTLLGISPFE
jgi:hypothetical protein